MNIDINNNTSYNSHFLHGRMYVQGMWYRQEIQFGMKLIQTAAQNGNEKAINFLKQA